MLPCMALPGGSGGPLSVDDWIQAGFAELAYSGPNTLRIGRLCQWLNVTKGSFYWHFADMQAYRAALVEAWGVDRGAGDAHVGADRRTSRRQCPAK